MAPTWDGEGQALCIYQENVSVRLCWRCSRVPPAEQTTEVPPPPWWLVWAMEILSNPRARLQNRRNAAKPFIFISSIRHAVSLQWHRRAVYSNKVSGCRAKQMTKLLEGGSEDRKQRRVMPQINRCIMQELSERKFGITTEEFKTEAIKWMMSYSAESLNPFVWYSGIVFRRVYLR